MERNILWLTLPLWIGPCLAQIGEHAYFHQLLQNENVGYFWRFTNVIWYLSHRLQLPSFQQKILDYSRIRSSNAFHAEYFWLFGSHDSL